MLAVPSDASDRDLELALRGFGKEGDVVDVAGDDRGAKRDRSGDHDRVNGVARAGSTQEYSGLLGQLLVWRKDPAAADQLG
jgi:hypothetical protein